MKLHVVNFVSNTERNLSDIIHVSQINVDTSGVVCVRLAVNDKYYKVYSDGLYCGPECFGPTLTLQPYLRDVPEEDYYGHKDWFILELVLDTEEIYVTQIMSLRYEVLWILTPSRLYSLEDMSDLEIVDHVDAHRVVK